MPQHDGHKNEMTKQASALKFIMYIVTSWFDRSAQRVNAAESKIQQHPLIRSALVKSLMLYSLHGSPDEIKVSSRSGPNWIR